MNYKINVKTDINTMELLGFFLLVNTSDVPSPLSSNLKTLLYKEESIFK